MIIILQLLLSALLVLHQARKWNSDVILKNTVDICWIFMHKDYIFSVEVTHTSLSLTVITAAAYCFFFHSRCFTVLDGPNQVYPITMKQCLLLGLECRGEPMGCKLICMKGQDTFQKPESHARPAAVVSTGLSSRSLSPLRSECLSSHGHTPEE